MKTHNIVLLFAFFAIIVNVFASDRYKECEPNTRFREDCNNCVCTADGRKACTRMFCNPPPLKEPGQSCVPNSTFKTDCNTCRCNAKGTEAICTLRACLPISTVDTVELQ